MANIDFDSIVRLINEQWQCLKEDLNNGVVQYDDLEKIINEYLFFDRFDNIFQETCKFCEVSLSEIKIIYRGARREVALNDYGRMIPTIEHAKGNNRMNPPGKVFFYAGVLGQDKGKAEKIVKNHILKTVLKEIRAEENSIATICKFKVNDLSKHKKVINICGDSRIPESKNEFNEYIVRNSVKNLNVNEEKLSCIIANVYFNMFSSDQIFKPVNVKEEEGKKYEYAPFHALANYISEQGYAGIIYRSTVHQNGTNLVLFEPKDVSIIENSMEHITHLIIFKLSYVHKYKIERVMILMINKDTFADWLKINTDLKQYAIKRYSRAIETLPLELEDYRLQKINLFNLSDTAFIDTILKNPVFKMKDTKGHRMYSTALKHFKKYIDYYYDSELQTELFKEEQEFEKYLTGYLADVNKINIEDKPKDKPNYRSVNNRKVWSRNPKNASESVLNANYLCEFDSQHKHFISKFNSRNYVEAHHLIPMQYQEQFENSIDIHANIVSICLICHKKIHHGLFEDKKEIIDKLFNSRRERLIKGGIKITLEELNSYYQD